MFNLVAMPFMILAACLIIASRVIKGAFEVYVKGCSK